MEDRNVVTVKRLESGYVRLLTDVANCWAQMPIEEWELLLPGELVPDQYTFEPSWGRLKKPSDTVEVSR